MTDSFRSRFYHWRFNTRLGRWFTTEVVWRWRSCQNWRKGYRFSPIQRCRRCGHTTPYHYETCWNNKVDET